MKHSQLKQIIKEEKGGTVIVKIEKGRDTGISRQAIGLSLIHI